MNDPATIIEVESQGLRFEYGRWQGENKLLAEMFQTYTPGYNHMSAKQMVEICLKEQGLPLDYKVVYEGPFQAEDCFV